MTDEYKGRSLALADEVQYAKGSVVSKTIFQKKTGSLTLFAFDRGQSLSEHISPYDATVMILDGTAVLMIGREEIIAKTGEIVIMPANISHNVKASERFKMLLIMIR
ncbi:MAG: cupin domain-containing protein [Lentisphaerae bacterium]|nr:cupin domain-containing protein [Lentisphaerota bacterium]